MFLFSKKHKTPVSTYTDSYRPPCSVKKMPEQAPPKLWKENKFVTQGLTMPPEQNPASRGQPERLTKTVTQEYYRNTVDTIAYQPEKYWRTRFKETYNPVSVNEDKCITWRTGSYSSAAWNKHSSYLSLLPKETFLHSIPVPYPLKPICLNRYEREMVTNTLHRMPVYTVTGRGPCQGYYSPSSGCYYCLPGTDYYIDGAHAIRRHLHTLEESAEYPVLQLQPQSDVLYIYTSPPAILPVQKP
ncbi:Spermatid-specific manchette-related protein 1 [Tauraco erythrolophus]|uniref:Spermatid-specific manchette-related protein 1 n=1 Tax=Tauraco erythrolophus TaxID=121530 RepID=A0A093BWI9_TAUER|nr:Spermatid-specific manchette-related protein 1 [Tauraco erythrolophus]